MEREKDFWDFDRPADWTTRDEMIRAGLYFIATKRRYERETGKGVYTNTNIDKLKLHTKKESGCRHE